jgi:hypothetical protein
MYRDDGPDVITFVEAGGLGRHGMNAAGVAVSGNYLRCDRDYTTEGGVPLALVRRKAMDQEHVALAMQAIAATPKACATNMIVSHKDGWAIDFECAPDEAFPLYPVDGILVHANHWVSPTALLKLGHRHRDGAGQLLRDWRVAAARSEHGGASRPQGGAVPTISCPPYSVCRPPRRGARRHHRQVSP